MLLDRVTALEWLRARFELSRGGAGQNIRPMEGLRGFAVFLVFLVHYANLIRPWLLPESSLLEFYLVPPDRVDRSGVRKSPSDDLKRSV